MMVFLFTDRRSRKLTIWLSGSVNHLTAVSSSKRYYLSWALTVPGTTESDRQRQRLLRVLQILPLLSPTSFRYRDVLSLMHPSSRIVSYLLFHHSSSFYTPVTFQCLSRHMCISLHLCDNQRSGSVMLAQSRSPRPSLQTRQILGPIERRRGLLGGKLVTIQRHSSTNE